MIFIWNGCKFTGMGRINCMSNSNWREFTSIWNPSARCHWNPVWNVIRFQGHPGETHLAFFILILFGRTAWCLRPQLHWQINCNKHLPRTHHSNVHRAPGAHLAPFWHNTLPSAYTAPVFPSSLLMCGFVSGVVLVFLCKCPCHIWWIYLKIGTPMHTTSHPQVRPMRVCLCVRLRVYVSHPHNA